MKLFWRILEFIDIPLRIRRKRFIGKRVHGNINGLYWHAIHPDVSYDRGVCTNVWRNMRPLYNCFINKIGFPIYLYELNGHLRTFFGVIEK